MSVKLDDEGILFPDGSKQYKINDSNEFYVYNADHWTPLNGGKLCSWTVPTGTTSIKFELLSGGGPGGSSGNDYDIGNGGQGGNFTSKSITKAGAGFVDDEVYTICAAGTSDCSCCMNCNMNCRHGCTSYVTGTGLTNLCAIGGMGGSTSWDVMSNCYGCMISNTQCSKGNYNAGHTTHACNTPTYGGDIEFRGTTGGFFRGYGCCSHQWGTAGGPTGPYTTSGTAIVGNACAPTRGCCMSHAAFPGGGGAGNSTANGNDCWGGFGAGGLVKVIYS